MYNRKPMGKEKKKEESTEEAMDPNLSFRNIMKDVVKFSSTCLTWKDRKALENKKVVELGGKPQKNQRLPLSVARVQMKKQKEREEKMAEQNLILGRFGAKFGSGSTKKPTEKKRRPEERVLKSTVGNFKSGVLDVRDLLHSGPSRTNDRGFKMGDFGLSTSRGGGEGKKKGKKNGEKKGKKGGGKRKK